MRVNTDGGEGRQTLGRVVGAYGVLRMKEIGIERGMGIGMSGGDGMGMVGLGGIGGGGSKGSIIGGIGVTGMSGRTGSIIGGIGIAGDSGMVCLVIETDTSRGITGRSTVGGLGMRIRRTDEKLVYLLF
jgi:hypothetical protein